MLRRLRRLEALDLNLKSGGAACADNAWDNYGTKEMSLRHNGRTNMIYCDGHVKSIGWQELLTRKGDNVAPWMIKWLAADCPGGVCPPPVAGAGQCFDPNKLP